LLLTVGRFETVAGPHTPYPTPRAQQPGCRHGAAFSGANKGCNVVQWPTG